MTTGTVFHRCTVPLLVWLLATYLVASDQRGITPLPLARELGVACHTAGLWCHQIQPAVVGVGLNAEGRPVYAFLETVRNLPNETILGVWQQRAGPERYRRTDEADGCAAPKLQAY